MKEVFLKFDSFIRIFPSDFSYWLEENNIDTDSFDIREDNIDKLKSRGVIFSFMNEQDATAFRLKFG